jgi:hypothetical protein
MQISNLNTVSGRASNTCGAYFQPKQTRNKYSTLHSHVTDRFVPKNLEPNVMGLICASNSQSSWKKHAAAMSCFKRFLCETNSQCSWPISEKTLESFIVFAAVTQKLKYGTVKSYISSLNFYQKLRGWDATLGTGFVSKTMLKGIKNLEFYRELTKPARKAMTMPVLKLLSHQVAVSNWEKTCKQVYWTAFSVAFFGSFRFGELLSVAATSFNSSETLLWRDVVVEKDTVILHVKVPKSKNKNGEFIELFEIPGNPYCPVNALKKLKSLSKFSSDPNSPVFRFDDGSFLSSYALNRTLLSLLEPVLGVSAKLFSGHSFRAGVPSALANCPELASDSDIMYWGRWSSSSYKLYMRLNSNQKRHIYRKLVSALKEQ